MEVENRIQIKKPIKRRIIDNHKSRSRVMYKKRKACIIKKTMELSILCDINAFTICFGPNNEVETWPENPTHVKTLINTYKNDRRGKQLVQAQQQQPSDHHRGLDDKIRGLLGWNDGWLCGLSREQLMSLWKLMKLKLQELTRRIELLMFSKMHYQYQPLIEPPMFVPLWPLNCYGVPGSSGGDSGGGGELSVPLTWEFNETLEETTLNAMNNCDINQMCLQFSSPLNELLFASMYTMNPLQITEPQLGEETISSSDIDYQANPSLNVNMDWII
ncbi:hypothetical protein ACSBR2_020247 [Camellia fascicularis]